MAIKVEVFGALVPKERRRQAIDTDKPLTVGEIVSTLGLEPEEIGLATIDGVQSRLEDVVPLGSRVCLFPPMSGG
jgi:hypothetical protein